MLAVKETELYDGEVVADYMKKVYAGETLEVSGANNKKAIVIPIDAFDEFIRLKEEHDYWDKIDRGIEAFKRGEPGIRKTMEELEAMANE